MKSIKTILGIVLATAGFGGAVSVGIANSNQLNLLNVTAAEPTNTRRVWVIDNNGSSSDTSWWTGSTLWAYVWNTNGSATIKVSEEVLSDYYKGLWYFDVSLAGATTSLNVIMRVGNANGPYNWGNNNQTFTQPLGAFGEADTIWLNNGVSWDSSENRNSRSASIGASNGFSGDQLAVIMSKYDTCSAANTNGYHAYPQVKINFIDKTDASALSTKVYGQTTYTIQDYLDGMSIRHNANK